MNKILLLLLVITSGTAFAGEELTGNPERKRSSSEAFSESVYKKFEKLQEMIADEKYVEARAGLEALSSRHLNPFEEANVSQYLGWVDSAEGKYVAAAKHFEEALASDALPNTAHFNIMVQVAQLYMIGGEYQKGIDALHAYYKVTDKIEDKTFALEANAYAQMEKFSKAVPLLIKAIKLADKPNEQWMYLLFSLHMELSQFQEAAKVMEQLVEINPDKKDYWIRLYGVYFNLKQDKKALATLVIADENGLLDDEKNRETLFKMYALMEVPYKAAQILEDGLKSGVIKSSFKKWDDLGKVWYTAAEMDKALAAFDEASKLSADGRIDFQRANIYFERQDWKSAKMALKQALEKGGLKESQLGNSWLLMGMAESETGNMSGAIAALKNAKKYKNSRKNAVQWLEHLEKQMIRDKAEAERARILAGENSEA